jgi:hypothetical protein
MYLLGALFDGLQTIYKLLESTYVSLFFLFKAGVVGVVGSSRDLLF